MNSPLLAIFLLLAISSCTEQKKMSATAESVSTEMTKIDEMTANGFVPGVIIASEEGSGCPYTIKSESLNYSMDPTNLADNFMKDQLKVWVKFNPLRMQSRCKGTTPVEVQEMQKRK